eukprot:GEMP01080425.1.p1 GENE.GEMP01080425.1~~GEMP01080425.1.p1  ORF type:complete len:123 (+),score=22.57 GEMP01080425.1:329-697(+)
MLRTVSRLAQKTSAPRFAAHAEVPKVAEKVEEKKNYGYWIQQPWASQMYNKSRFDYGRVSYNTNTLIYHNKMFVGLLQPFWEEPAFAKRVLKYCVYTSAWLALFVYQDAQYRAAVEEGKQNN